jgi:succinoglycan biosynthesis transport protein ExoP
MNTVDLFGTVWRRKSLFLAIMSLALALGVLVVRFAPRVYEAETFILVDPTRTIKEQTGGDGPSASGPNQEERMMKSQVKIAQGETVLFDVVRRMQELSGENTTEKKSQVDSPFAFLPRMIALLVPPARLTADEKERLEVQSAVRIELEPNTNLLRIAFRNEDPDVAAKYANQFASSFIERSAALSNNPFASEFFREREEQYKQKLSKAAKDLEVFSTTNNSYSLERQRTLVLARRDKALSSIAETRNSAQKLESELQSLRWQLASLKSKINLPAAIFGDTTFSGRPNLPAGPADFGADPPLLHVKLYQDSAQKIMNLNADLAGNKALEAAQAADLQQIDAELRKLAEKAATFARLEREVSQNEANLVLYSRKSTEAQIGNAWKSNERLSLLRVVEPAIKPIRPIFPRTGMVLPVALLLGIMLGCAATLLPDYVRRQMPRQTERSDLHYATLPKRQVRDNRSYDAA